MLKVAGQVADSRSLRDDPGGGQPCGPMSLSESELNTPPEAALARSRADSQRTGCRQRTAEHNGGRQPYARCSCDQRVANDGSLGNVLRAWASVVLWLNTRSVVVTAAVAISA